MYIIERKGFIQITKIFEKTTDFINVLLIKCYTDVLLINVLREPYEFFFGQVCYPNSPLLRGKFSDSERVLCDTKQLLNFVIWTTIYWTKIIICTTKQLQSFVKIYR